MPYGFVIDQTRCIGCHACTVACKSENDVPVGDFRTWVKYTEIGTFPTVRRHFSVLRCNHCTNAPCVTICPVNALDKRSDGIVDLDRDVCIGCKACMQACPYDAIYLNEETGGAEKCHYCAHRVDQGLEPACVVVCPEEAIISGDFSDPESKIAKLRSRPDAVVRRPEQGTDPNVHYIGADPVSLNPGTALEPDSYIWSERRFEAPDYPPVMPDGVDLYPDAITVLDVNHKVHWGWKVSAYLVTKGIGAGAILLAPLVGAAAAGTNAGDYAPEIVGIFFLAVTLLLLVVDLKRPLQFLSILLRPNVKSWLVKGSWVLTAFGGAALGALVARAMGNDQLADILRYAGMPLAIGAACYTALLFAQCEGRDLWQNTRWLAPHLLAQTVFLGALVLLPFLPANMSLAWLVTIGGVAHAGISLREAYGGHETTNARLAASLMPRIPAWPGSKFMAFKLGLVITTIVSLAAPAVASAGWLNSDLGWVLASVLALSAFVGTFFYEQCYIRAGQLPPLS
jgi:Fe-S-cluster-containing dehydrogenase component